MSRITPPSSRSSSLHSEQLTDTAVPTLRVMRLQSPELSQPKAGSLGSQCLLQTSLCLPDSLGVYVGERFTAYLGILNSSKSLPIRRLAVAAQLQTPSQRWQLASRLDPGSASGGIDVEPNSGVDAIVSHDIEEAGQHILRVEVGYITAEGGTKTFRKFYRFNVVSPLTIRELSVRSGDSACFVSISVEFNTDQANSESLVITSAVFVPAEGLSAEQIGTGSATKLKAERKTAIDLLDSSGLLLKGASFRYLFKVQATSKEAVLKGIAAGDMLGKAVFTWRKAMGETGRISSSAIFCPKVRPELPGPTGIVELGSNFVVYKSGLSVDVAAAAATRSSRSPVVDSTDLSRLLPVTVEPIDPPKRMLLNSAKEVQFLVVNHSEQAMTLQLQFRLPPNTGLTVCGPSFKSVGVVQPNGGSTVVAVRFLPLAEGLMKVQGCFVVDLVSGREIHQPPLFHVFVESDASQ